MLFSEKRDHAVLAQDNSILRLLSERYELFFKRIIYPCKEPLEILGLALRAVRYSLSQFQPKYNMQMEENIGNAFGSPGQPAFPKMRACGKLFSSYRATGLMDFSANKFPNNESAVQFLAKVNEHTLTHSERR